MSNTVNLNDPTENWTEEYWDEVIAMLETSEKQFENGEYRDAFEVLTEARIKYGL